ncbi:type IV pilus biogenesis/stability protein PilW [Caulobacter sp. 17J80-11]|uniref:tetratricopeptide repeat protein n=1 Tax=Caulobacter sp. 17J80-11 TaxID=2763502 RepID=UPI001653C77F|nr:hypothetical protein [Caulobacter sp. 17J80-11]MBC6980483.1 hypothetical protein [Caulobacter sp. 17J80-11]
MSEAAERRPAEPAKRLAAAAAIGVGALMAWQIVAQAAADRLPPAAALKLAPRSPRLLALEAEAELEAGRPAAAESLARRALLAQPLNARALRVLGIAVDRGGDPQRADDLVTQAGNWSLRDGPAHVWLVDQRLRQGDFASAFAHADALMRRKPELQPHFFKLLSAAAAADRRALAPIAERLAHQPAWREPFLQNLASTPKGLESAATLAIMLQPGRAPLSDKEQGFLLTRLVNGGQFADAAGLRRRLAPAAAAVSPFDGEFDDRAGPAPFRWQIESGAGASVEIAPDDRLAGQSALRVEYDGYSTPGLIHQFVVLSAGAHELEVRWRSDTPVPAERLAWTVRCIGDNRIAARAVQPAAAAPTPWRASSIRFEVPAEGCAAQWLELRALPGDRRTTLVVWYDGMKIRPANGSAEK